jgi:hypothetical protein
MVFLHHFPTKQCSPVTEEPPNPDCANTWARGAAMSMTASIVVPACSDAAAAAAAAM